MTDEGGGRGGPQALTRAIFNWCVTGSVAEGARWGPGGPAPFLDLLKTWGWGPPASPSSQTDTPVAASEAAPLGEGQAQAQSTPLGPWSHLFLLAASDSPRPSLQSPGLDLGPKSLSCHVAFPPSSQSPLDTL